MSLRSDITHTHARTYVRCA